MVVAASVGSTSFVLSWSPPPTSQQNGIIREYTVNITEIQTGISIILNSTSTSVSVLSLHPYYTYECRVSAYTVGSGPYSEVFTITTPEDGMSHLCSSLFCVRLANTSTVTKCSFVDTCDPYFLDYKLVYIFAKIIFISTNLQFYNLHKFLASCTNYHHNSAV